MRSINFYNAVVPLFEKDSNGDIEFISVAVVETKTKTSTRTNL